MNESLLVNTLGHSAGVLMFGIFLYLLIQDRAARRLRGSTKPILAAALALVWNLASLVVLGMGSRTGELREITVAVAFSVLSLLPAVLFDLCLGDRQLPLAGAGYALSAVAIALHVAELFRENEQYHLRGLTLITIGFGALTCIAAGKRIASREQHRRATTSRLLATMSLFLLAMSFVHLSGGHAQQVWSRELAFHHAAIPLALLVLLQDYRFVLLDAFLRFLANVLLAGVFVSAVFTAWQLHWIGGASTPFEQALLLMGACLLLVAFAMLRRTVQALLTRLVFRRADANALLRSLQVPVTDEAEYIDAAVKQLGAFMSADVSLTEEAPAPETLGIEAAVPLRIPSRRTRYILLGRRAGGRRYLSEDLAALHRAAGLIVEQVEQYRESEMRRLVAQAELRALQSQIHPHFLFNALNALYGIIPREAKGARETVLNLADIFRYFLETRKTFLPLEEELRIVKAYLEVERLRLGDKLRTEIDVPAALLPLPIPVLSIQPLVENAVKHAIAPQPQGGLVRLEARLHSGVLKIAVNDTGAGFKPSGRQGVGLENVKRRLELCYGPDARLEVDSSTGGSIVSILVPAAAPAPADLVEEALH